MGALMRAERRTSQAPQQEQAAARGRQYLTFVVAGESFATAIASIKEIIEYGNITEVPRMPDFIRGVINLRGAVVPVLSRWRWAQKIVPSCRRSRSKAAII